MLSHFWDILGTSWFPTQKTWFLFQTWERKLKKVSDFLKEISEFQYLTFLAEPWPVLKSSVKLRVIIELYALNAPQNICHTMLILYFDSLTLFDLALTLRCAYKNPLLVRPLRHLFSNPSYAWVSGHLPLSGKGGTHFDPSPKLSQLPL